MPKFKRQMTHRCSGCRMEIAYGGYAVAQITMGHRLTYTHSPPEGCGSTSELDSDQMEIDAERAILSVGSREPFFISDTHFGHAKIIEYCKRPFKDVDEMDSAMISRWNERVGKDDIVILVGDFAFGKKSRMIEIRKQLNGYIILVLGNHDRSFDKMLEVGFDEVHEKLNLTVGRERYFVSHIPSSPLEWEGADFQICGHVHDAWVRDERRINVGAEVNNFYPLTLNQLLGRK